MFVNSDFQNSGQNGYNSIPGVTLLQNPLEPYFDDNTLKNVTALVGKSAYLSCRVRNLGNKTVSIVFFCILTYFL